MDIFLSHIKSPFSYSLPEGSKSNAKSFQHTQISPTSKILCIASGLGIAILASRRYNVFASAAFGTTTFYATTGMAKYWKIAAIENRFSPRVSKETAVATFNTFLDGQKVNKNKLGEFLTDTVQEAMVKALKEIEADPKLSAKRKESFLKELKTYYEAFTQIEGRFTIHCKSVTGKSADFSISEDTITLQVKTQLFTKIGMTPRQITLIFAGRQLEDAKTITRFNTQSDVSKIQPDGTLYYVVKQENAWAYQSIKGE